MKHADKFPIFGQQKDDDKDKSMLDIIQVKELLQDKQKQKKLRILKPREEIEITLKSKEDSNTKECKMKVKLIDWF